MKTIANFLNSINNAQQTYKHYLKYPASNLTIELVTLLTQENFIRGFFIKNEKNIDIIYVLLKYGKNKQIFYRINLVSKSLIHEKCSNLIKYRNGLGVYIISSSQGLINTNDAIKLKLGGILLLKIF